jgi:hypothetical protein
VAASFNRAGGARIGWINASWPLAELSVTPRSLVIRVWPLGTYTFTPEQIVRVEPYGSIPVSIAGSESFTRVPITGRGSSSGVFGIPRA